MSARRAEPIGAALAGLLLFAAAATTLIALWSLWVSLTVLPARDPAHVAMWQVIAIVFLGYAAASGAAIARPRPWFRGALLVLSLAAIGAGGYAVFTMLAAAGRGQHFEGYIVLIGLALAGHGLCGVMFSLLGGAGPAPTPETAPASPGSP